MSEIVFSEEQSTIDVDTSNSENITHDGLFETTQNEYIRPEGIRLSTIFSILIAIMVLIIGMHILMVVSTQITENIDVNENEFTKTIEENENILFNSLSIVIAIAAIVTSLMLIRI